MSFRLGCDIGGTFTDVVLFDETANRITLVKQPTTPSTPETGAAKSIDRALREANVSPDRVRYVSHATTVATNAIIGQIGLPLARTGLITTKGFRDLIEIGRQIRPDPYDFFTDKPRPLVPGVLRREVRERVGSDGGVLEPLDEQDARRVARELKREHVDAVAVCTLFSFLNPKHEKRIGQIIMEGLPTATVSLSHEVLPEFREYERMTTTVINAALTKIVKTYISNFKQKLGNLGLLCDLLIMQSNGRAMNSKTAESKPVHMVESGPAAGAIAAAHVGKLTGHKGIVSFDMGGTSAKACTIKGGEPKVTTDFEVGGTWTSGRIVRGSGWPIKTPVTDLVEIGAGGGSIAWIDRGGVLKVGPESVGADPGPSCYGAGGDKATITDAYVVLGAINPEYFLGGTMKIDARLARKAVKQQVADPLGMDVVEAANGIAEVANSNMTRALRIVTVERGEDPRQLPVIAFGGAGPMVVGRLMDELGFASAIIPEAPGLFSAYGLLVTDIGHDYALTYLARTRSVNLDALNAKYQELADMGIRDLTTEEVPQHRIVLARTADMRYVGQSYELNILVPDGPITESVVNELERRFNLGHEAQYGYCAEKEPTEIVNLRVSAIGLMPAMMRDKKADVGRDPQAARKGVRELYFSRQKSYTKCEVYDKYRLEPGNVVRGPAIIEQADTTTVLQPHHMAKIDGYDQVVISRVE